jgi:hypothetical protein
MIRSRKVILRLFTAISSTNFAATKARWTAINFPSESVYLETCRSAWGFQLIRIPPRAQNLNAFAERFMRSIKFECLSRITFFGEASFSTRTNAIRAGDYYHERNHQGFPNQLQPDLVNDSSVATQER